MGKFSAAGFYSLLVCKGRKAGAGIKNLDKRTCGYKRRLEAITKSTEHLEAMVKRVIELWHQSGLYPHGQLVLLACDPCQTWAHLPVISMAKNMPKVFYRHQDQWVTLGKLYTRLRKRPGKARILASIVVETKQRTESEDRFCPPPP